jgi:hypothetical protein
MATTNDVRDCFLGQVVALPDGSLGFGDIAELGREFDAWIAQVKADAVIEHAANTVADRSTFLSQDDAKTRLDVAQGEQ